MMSYWHDLNARQQRLLILTGLFLLAVGLWIWVWEPLAAAREVERERVAQQQALLGWLEAVGPMATQLRRHSQRSSDLEGRSLLGLADETARAAGLAGALARIEPAGEGQVRVWLEQADFVATMGWLENLSLRYPIQVGQLSVDRARNAGQVNVRVTLISDSNA